MKKNRPKCLRGKKHGPDEWKMAKLILNKEIILLNLTKGLECSIKDLKNVYKTKTKRRGKTSN